MSYLRTANRRRQHNLPLLSRLTFQVGQWMTRTLAGFTKWPISIECQCPLLVDASVNPTENMFREIERNKIILGLSRLLNYKVTLFCQLSYPSATSSHFYEVELFLFKPWRPWRPKGCFQFEIIINAFVTCKLGFICILILWVYGNYTYFNPFSAGTVFIRQNLTSTDVRFWCIKTVSVLKGLIVRCELLSQIPFQVNRNVHIYKFIKISHNEQTNPYNVVLSRVIPFIIQ